MGFLTLDLFFEIVLSSISLAVVTTVYIKYSYTYWRRRKVPFLEPTFPFGNSDSLIPKGVSIGVLSKTFYEEFKSKGHMIGGVYIGLTPNLVILDPDDIKHVLVKDFQHFVDRGVYYTENDPLTVHLFSQPGTQWKNSRVKFTSVFTSAKMKSMFQTMLDCCEGLDEALENLAEEKADVDMLEVAACFTTDIIGSCVFGVECNGFEYPDAEFRKMGRRYFKDHSLIDRLNLCISIYMPSIARKVGVRNVQKDISRFFIKTIEDTVAYREKHKVRRNDFLQLLIDMKNSEVGLTIKELTGQIFLFFTAGFETSSTTTCLALFEISKNEQVQKRLRQEIWEVLGRYDYKITYDAIAEMKYLGQVVDALRFGLLQSKLAIVAILNKYEVSLSPKTVTPLGMDPRTFVLVTSNKVYLNLEKI